MSKRTVFKDPVKEAELCRLMALATEAHKAASDADEVVRKYIQTEFNELFKGVKWGVVRWGSDYRLSPIGHEAEGRMVLMAGIALGLGYHSGFSLHADGVYIDGRVDDGDFTIELNVYAKSDKLEESFKFLDIDVDLQALVRQAVEEELEWAFQEKEAAEQKHEVLKAKLDALKDIKPLIDQAPPEPVEEE